MKIAVVGPGAVGGLLAARLSTVADVSVIGRGEHLNTIRDRGLEVIGPQGETFHASVNAVEAPADVGPVDILVVALKGHSLVDCASTLTPLVAAHTTIVPAINGVPWWFFHGFGQSFEGTVLNAVDSGGAVTRALPPQQTVGCVVHLASRIERPGVIRHVSGERLILGEPNGTSTERLATLVDLFQRAEMAPEATSSIQHEVWMKLWGNMTMNPISALTGATTDVILDSPLTHDLATSIMQEAKQIGEAIGIATSLTPEDRNNVTRKLGAFRTSMLQDSEKGQKLEIDGLLRAPYEIAQRAGARTPMLAAVLGLLYQREHVAGRA